MTDTPQKTGIIYVRVSSLEQVDGTSLESQERLCKEYAERTSVDVKRVFIEKGESAKTADRTEFQKAIAFCSNKKSKIDFFIVYKLDRFARNQNDHAMVTTALRRYGTILRSVTEPINDTPTGQLMEGILSSFAQFDNSIRTERSRGGMMERLKQGVWVFRAPIGYHRPFSKSNIVPDPDTAPFIRLAFEEYAKGGYTYDSLAKLLAKRGLRGPKGKKLLFQQAEKMLRNPLYCGIMSGLGMQYQGAYEPIISETLFQQCQPGFKSSHSKHRNSKNPNFPLRGLLICGHCNHPITGSTSTGRMKKGYSYYHHHKRECEHSAPYKQEPFEQSFHKHLLSLKPSDEYLLAFKEVVLDIWKNQYLQFDQQNEKLRAEIKQLEGKRQNIFDYHEKGIYSDAEFVERKNKISMEIAEREVLIQDNRGDEFDVELALEYCLDFVRNAGDTWLRIKNRPTLVEGFQNLIFKEKLPVTDGKFGTAKLSSVYALEKEYRNGKSHLVTQTGIIWNQVYEEITQFHKTSYLFVQTSINILP